MKYVLSGRKGRQAVVCFIACSAGTVTASAEDTGSCYAITDMDARTWCLAKAHKDPGQCFSIQGSSARSMCLAEVRK